MVGKDLTIKHFNGTTQHLPFHEFNHFGHGGTGMVFVNRSHQPAIMIKVITNPADKGDFFRRLKALHQAFSGIPHLHRTIKTRSLPFGQGIINSSMLGPSFSDVNETYPLAAFQYVDGMPLNQYLDGVPLLDARRMKLCKQLVRILEGLEQAGVVHYDLYPDNFLVDADCGLHLIDLESAGIRRNDTWLWRPAVWGKTGIFCIPPEATEARGEHSPFFDRWNGMFLVHRILFDQHPLEFLTRCDASALVALSGVPRPANGTWPPEITGIRELERFCKDPASVASMRATVATIFKTSASRAWYSGLLFRTFVAGWSNPAGRPAMGSIQRKMGTCLNSAFKASKTNPTQ